MKESSHAYLPQDRFWALVEGTRIAARSEGAVLFADISGFTPLTEAYEEHLGARKGGEELARVLNEVYTALIGEVDTRRGSVIGFAGDAITCWFDEDDGRRAVGCALAMQDVMTRFEQVPAPGGGIVSLGLKAAVSTGPVRRFVVGDEAVQWVDVLAGEPVYRVARVEQLADRGETLVDESTRRRLGDALGVGETRESGETRAFVVTSLHSRGDALPWADPGVAELDMQVLDPWILATTRKRLRSGLGEFFTELRPATALFMMFGGIDYDHDEAANEKLDTLFSGAQEIVTRNGGIVHQLTLGDKGSFLYAAFGAPISHEDDTQRTLSTALKLREFVASLGYAGNLRIGIGRGTTRTGAYGATSRRTYGVLGDQVNLAARLMGKAQEGQILVSEVAAREGMHAYDLRRLAPITVKGKSAPVQVFSLEGVREQAGLQRLLSAGTTPMIGRRAELGLVVDAMGHALTGRGQMVSVIAEAGMGKTRLLAECMREAHERGFRVLFGECQGFGSKTPYLPWWSIWRELYRVSGTSQPGEIQQRLHAWFEETAPELVMRLPLLAPVLNTTLADNELTSGFDSKLRRASMEGLLVESLRAESKRQPVCIVLEEAHTMDAVSRDLLAVILQAIARIPVFLLLAHRPVAQEVILGPDELALEYVKSVQLNEFSPTEAVAFIQMKYEVLWETRAALPSDVSKEIAIRTGGNPFFIEEVMNWMHHRGLDIRSRASLTTADLPVSLHALVLSRMDQLEENARVTMKVASVIGRLFRAALVWGVYPDLGGEPPVREALERLTQHEFTVREDEDAELAYLFKHVVIHEVAYESVPHRLREKIHEAIGLWIEAHLPIESPQVLDLLAFHFGRTQKVEKTRFYALKAGDAAKASYANAAAAAHYETALPLIRDHERVAVLRKLGTVLEISGNWSAAMLRYEEALDRAVALEMRKEVAACRLAIADLHRKSGSLDAAAEWLAEAEDAFGQLGELAGLGQVLHSKGTLAAQQGRYDEAMDLYGKSLEIRRLLGDEAKVGSLLSNLGILNRFQGNLDQALSLQEQSLEIRRRLNDLWAIGNSLNNLGMARRYKGDLGGARKDLEEALSILRRVGDRAEIANTLNSLAEVALDQRDPEGCETYLLESLQLTRELGNLRAIAFLFESFAANALLQNQSHRSLLLFGAAAALRNEIGAPLPDADASRIQQLIEQAIASLPEGATKAHKILAKGRAMSVSRALDEAGTRIS